MPPFTSGTRSYGGGGGSFGGGGRSRISTPGQRAASRAAQQDALRAKYRSREQVTTTKVAPQKPSAEVMGLFTEAMKRFQPGGGFGKREEALLARAKKKYLASSAQSMVSAGLSGTTVPGAMGAKFQEEIGEPTRLGLEETRTSRLNELLMAKAGYMGGLGAGGKTTTTTQLPWGGSGGGTGGGYGGGGRVISGGVDNTGRAEISPTDFGAMRATEEAEQAAVSARISAPGFGARQIPEGGRIIGNTYFPPTRFTRNVPQLTL